MVDALKKHLDLMVFGLGVFPSVCFKSRPGSLGVRGVRGAAREGREGGRGRLQGQVSCFFSEFLVLYC